MDQNCYNNLLNSINVINNPISTNQDRLMAETICEEFQKRSDSAGYIFYILTTPSENHTNPIRHFALNALRNQIISQWDSNYTKEQKEEMKQFVLYYYKTLLKPMDQEPQYIRSKFADITCEILKREWPQRWEGFHLEIMQCMRQDVQHFYMGIVIFERLCSEVCDTSFNNRLSSKRRNDLNTGIGVITSDLVDICLPFLPRQNRATAETAIQHNDSEQSINIAQCVIRLLKDIIICNNKCVLENNFVYILSEICPWCIYEVLFNDIIDFIFAASQVKWLKERLSLYMGLYTSMLEIYIYMDKVFNDIPSNYLLWKNYWRVFSEMIPNLPAPKVEVNYPIYIKIYTLFVSLCNHPSFSIVDTALSTIPQLFADIGYTHALFPVYKESIINLYNNLYLCLSHCNEYQNTNPISEEINEIDFEDEYKYNAFINNFKNKAKIASEGIAKRFSYLALEAVNSLLSNYWIICDNKAMYRSLSIPIEGILNGCSIENINNFSFVSSLGINILSKLISIPLPSTLPANTPAQSPIYIMYSLKLLQCFHNLLTITPQYISPILSLCFEYSTYKYPTNQYTSDDVEEMNRVAAQTLTRISSSQGKLFVNYFKQIANEVGKINSNPDIRGSIKTAFIQALLNINKYIENEQDQYSMIYIVLEPSFKFLTSPEFLSTISDPNVFMNTYTQNSELPTNYFYTLSSHVVSISTILGTIIRYVNSEQFLPTIITQLYQSFQYLIIDILYSISQEAPHSCQYSRGWTDMELGGLKSNNKISAYYLSNAIINLFAQILNLFRSFTLCSVFYGDAYMNSLSSIITTYGTIFRYNHLRLWFVNVVIPLCYNVKPNYFNSITNVISVSIQLCHHFITTDYKQPYPLSPSVISAEDLDIVFNYNRVKLLHMYMDMYLYQAGIKYKGYAMNLSKDLTVQEIQKIRDDECMPLLLYLYNQETSVFSFLTTFTFMSLSCSDEYIYMQILAFLTKVLPLLSENDNKVSYMEEIFSILIQQLLQTSNVIKNKEWTILTLLSQIFLWLVINKEKKNKPSSQIIINFLIQLPGCSSTIYNEFYQNMKTLTNETNAKTIFKEFLDKILDANESSVSILGQIKPIRDIPEQLIIKGNTKVDETTDIDLRNNAFDI